MRFNNKPLRLSGHGGDCQSSLEAQAKIAPRVHWVEGTRWIVGLTVTCWGARALQGKMEKSFLSFQATYEGWTPDQRGRDLLNNLSSYVQLEEAEGAQAGADARARAEAEAGRTTSGAAARAGVGMAGAGLATLQSSRVLGPEADPLAVSGLLTEERQADMRRSHMALQRFLAHASPHSGGDGDGDGEGGEGGEGGGRSTVVMEGIA